MEPMSWRAGVEMRAADPVFLSSASYEPPRDPHELVADLLRGGRLW